MTLVTSTLYLAAVSARLEFFGQEPRRYRSRLIALTFIRSHIAPALVFWIGTRHTTLVGLQQIALGIGAAIRVASVNGRAAREQRDGLCLPAVISQHAKLGVNVVELGRA